MTTHCWGERPAGNWTLEIQDSRSQESQRAKPGLPSVFVTSQSFETGRTSPWKHCPGLQGRSPYLVPLPPPPPVLSCPVSGALKDWSLVIYGTAEPPPGPGHVKSVRSAKRQMEEDGEYRGQSHQDPKTPVGFVHIWTEILELRPGRDQGLGRGHGSPGWGRDLCQLLSFQDLVTQNAGTAAAGVPVRTTASCVCISSSSSGTPPGELDHSADHQNRLNRLLRPRPCAQGVCPPVSQGLLGRPPALQEMLLLLRELHRQPERPVQLLPGRPPPGGGHRHVHGRLRGRLLPGPR